VASTLLQQVLARGEVRTRIPRLTDAGVPHLCLLAVIFGMSLDSYLLQTSASLPSTSLTERRDEPAGEQVELPGGGEEHSKELSLHL
jgi:hypothetical protein